MSTMELMEQDELLEQEEDLFDLEENLKAELIDRIRDLHGFERLCDLSEYIDEKFPDCAYELTPEEERSIDEGLAQLDAGSWITGDEFRKEIDAWLNHLGKLYG